MLSNGILILSGLTSIAALLAYLSLRASKLQSNRFTQLQNQFTQFEQLSLTQQRILQDCFSQQQQQLLQSQHDSTLKLSQALQESLYQGIKATGDSLERSTRSLSERFDKLSETTEMRLDNISHRVEARLHEGFEKTNATFNDITTRLTIIDEAQKRIADLSTHVVDLQQVLTDKRSRGAFGEVQLSALLRNVLPESHFKLQYSLSNGKRCDCMLLLPEPTGNIVIDAKFPLEGYQRLVANPTPTEQQTKLEQQFRQDIKLHINNIASKYIIQHETADGAIMFIPAEAIFAEIHGHYPDLVEYAQKQRVWLASPTTLMAILTTSRAVIKDAATRKQIHLIQEHLGLLAQDFSRFRTRMDKLANHINQANKDVEEVHVSAQKISSRFEKIEQVELKDATQHPLPDAALSSATRPQATEVVS